MVINNTGSTLIEKRDFYQKNVAPLQSPRLSFINHLDFQVAKQCSDFSLWYQNGFIRLLGLYIHKHFVTSEYFLEKIQDSRMHLFQYNLFMYLLFQYNKVKNLVHKVQKTYAT